MPEPAQHHGPGPDPPAERSDALDLSDADTDELVETVRHWIITRNTLQTLGGRVFAELIGRGLSIRALSEETGLAKSTVDRWAAPYTRGGEA